MWLNDVSCNPHRKDKSVGSWLSQTNPSLFPDIWGHAMLEIMGVNGFYT